MNDQRCGTCKWFKSLGNGLAGTLDKGDREYGGCDWPAKHLPFILLEDIELTQPWADKGHDCPTWDGKP